MAVRPATTQVAKLTHPALPLDLASPSTGSAHSP